VISSQIPDLLAMLALLREQAVLNRRTLFTIVALAFFIACGGGSSVFNA
jgi:hypothetical protein